MRFDKFNILDILSVVFSIHKFLITYFDQNEINTYVLFQSK